MSNNTPDQGSSSAPNNIVEPRFFNLQTTPKKKEQDAEPEEPPEWLNPPPPYSSIINDQESAPSAPPLELVYDNQQQEPLLNNPQQSHNIPSPTNQNYGAITQEDSSSNKDSALKKLQTWIFTPSDNHHDKRNNGRFFRIFISLLFFVICVLSLIEFFSPAEDITCYNGIQWDDLPKQFNFTDKGLRIKTVGGQLSGGRISIKKQKDKAGTVEMYMLVNPPSLVKDPEFGFGFTRLFNGSTTLELYIPQSRRNHCIYFNAVIYLPEEKLTFFEGTTPNVLYVINDDIMMDVTVFQITTSNKRIDFHSYWKGELLSLTTQNEPINIGRPIYNSSLLMLETTNAPIRVRGDVLVDYGITMKTTNNDITTEKRIAAPIIVSSSSNGLSSHNQVESDRTEIKTTNGIVELSHGHITGVLNIQTTNAKLSINLDTCSNCTLYATTVNADTVVAMPKNYEGDFVARTRESGSIKLDDCTDWTQLRHIEEYEVEGTRFNPSNTDHTGGHVVAQTYQGDVYLTFGKRH